MKFVNCFSEYHHKPMPPSAVATPLLTTKRPGPHWRHCFKAVSEKRNLNPSLSSETTGGGSASVCLDAPEILPAARLTSTPATAMTKQRHINCSFVEAAQTCALNTSAVNH